MIVVLDASALVDAQLDRGAAAAFRALRGQVDEGAIRLIAPDIMWSEATSALRGLVLRGALEPDAGARLQRLVERVPVEAQRPAGLRRRAWEIATSMGWGRTYDAEYCALAELRGGLLATRDGALHRAAAGRLDYVVTIEEAARRATGA